MRQGHAAEQRVHETVKHLVTSKYLETKSSGKGTKYLKKKFLIKIHFKSNKKLILFLFVLSDKNPTGTSPGTFENIVIEIRNVGGTTN